MDEWKAACPESHSLGESAVLGCKTWNCRSLGFRVIAFSGVFRSGSPEFVFSGFRV